MSERTATNKTKWIESMISHERFGTLRLVQFLPDAEIDNLENWEFMDHHWLGEAIGFSEWLRLEKEPDVPRSLVIDFTEFPRQAAMQVIRVLELPIKAGLGLTELRQLLGAPEKELRFANDRVT